MAGVNQSPSKKIIFHKPATFMDYLHGDVKDGEAWIACLYEYARESKDMWDAAKLLDDARVSGNLNCEKDFWRIHYEFEHWIRVTDWTTCFLMCESFPETDWNALSAAEREKILRFERRTVAPLHLQWLYDDAGTLKRKREGGFIDFPEFDELAARTVPVVKNVRPGENQEPLTKTEAMVQKSGSVYYCLFRVDFSESKNLLHDRFVAWLKRSDIEQLWQEHKKQRDNKNRNALRPAKIVQWHVSSHWCLFEVDLSARKGDLTKQFDKWLASSENKKRLVRHCLNKSGKTGEWKDRLKDLAAWRLYRENQNSCDKANKFANDNRKRFKTWQDIHATCKKMNGKWPYKPNDPKPFYNAKALKSENSPPTLHNQADLFSHDEDYRHAKSNALKLLSDWIPSGCEKYLSELMKEWKMTDKNSAKN